MLIHVICSVHHFMSAVTRTLTFYQSAIPIPEHVKNYVSFQNLQNTLNCQWRLVTSPIQRLCYVHLVSVLERFNCNHNKPPPPPHPLHAYKHKEQSSPYYIAPLFPNLRHKTPAGKMPPSPMIAVSPL